MRIIRTLIPAFLLIGTLSSAPHAFSQQAAAQAAPVQDPYSTNDLVSIGPEENLCRPPLVCFAGGGPTATVTPPTPVWAIYQFFFAHLANVDQVADEAQAAGQTDEANSWRTHEQRAVGLNDTDAQTMKQVAYDCNAALQVQDAQIQVAITAFHTQYSDVQMAGATPSASMTQLWNERIQIINSHIDQLRLLLGDATYQTLDTYIQTNFTPNTGDLSISGASATKGGSQ